MKRSTVLYGILAGIVVILFLLPLFIPQQVLDDNEMVFLVIVMPLMGWMWFQAYKDAVRGN